MKDKKEKRIELSLTDKQREIIKNATEKDIDRLSLRSVDDEILPIVKNGPLRLKLTDQQKRAIAEVTGKEYKALFFDIVGSEPIFYSLPNQSFPICVPLKSIYDCKPDAPGDDGCSSSHALLTPDKPLIHGFVPHHLRGFRDAVLKGTRLGEKIIKAKTDNDEELGRLLNTHADLREEAQELLLKNAALVRAVTLAAVLPETTPLELNLYTSPDNIQELIDFFDKLGKYASEGLKNAIEDIKGELPQFNGTTTQEVLELFRSQSAETSALEEDEDASVLTERKKKQI